ncbi:MAG TPA: hypothetical protein VK927_02855, partial [Adhaeribacter sp.]|nr:hypothetical protein [Adhaeribacter sp.]
SYKEGLEYILATDPRPVIKVYPTFISGSIAWDILKPEHQQRLQYVEPEEADYILADYRWHPQPYPYPNHIYTIKANGIVILSVFKLK